MWKGKYKLFYVLFCFFISIILIPQEVHSAEKIRLFTYANALYPGEPEVLRETLRNLFAQQPESAQEGKKLVACMVPHSEWKLCGDLIAKSFASIPKDTYNTVLVIAPSHYYSFRGCSVPSVQGFATPLGVARVQFTALERLSTSPYIEIHSLQKNINRRRRAIHEKEYSIEVLLPMLQYQMKKFELIPIIVGEFKDDYGKESQPVFSNVVSTIRRILTPNTLIILSTDLTSCGKSFGFTPAPTDQLLSEQEKLDKRLLELIAKKDLIGIQEFFEETKSYVCGKNAIYLFTALLPKNAQAEVIGYAQSGVKLNQTENSVGFGAVNFYLPQTN